MRTQKVIRIASTACLAGLLFLGIVTLTSHPSLSAQAAPDRQVPIYTPTALPDGRIIYTVKPGDSLLSISLLTGVSVDELRALNNLSNDVIIEGQPLLLGMAGPVVVTPTEGPSPTPTTVVPTPSPMPGSGDICVLLFDDVNGDSIRQEEEPSIPGGAINVTNRPGTVSLTAEIDNGTEHHCFTTVPEGDYNITVAVPSGYNATTVNNYALQLKPGDQAYLDFGAQASSELLAEAPPPSEGGRSPLLAVVGGVILVAGIGLAVFAGRLMKTG